MSSCDYYIYREDHDFGPVGLSVCLFDGKITDKTPGMFFLMCCKEVTWIINEQIKFKLIKNTGQILKLFCHLLRINYPFVSCPLISGVEEATMPESPCQTDLQLFIHP